MQAMVLRTPAKLKILCPRCHLLQRCQNIKQGARAQSTAWMKWMTAETMVAKVHQSVDIPLQFALCFRFGTVDYAASPPYCPSTSWPSVNNVDDTPPRAFWTSPTQAALDLAEAAYQSPDMWDEEDPLIMEKLQKQWWWPQYGDGEAPYLCEEHFRKGALYGLMLPGSRCAMTWFPLPLPVRLCKQLQNFPPVVSHSSCHGFYASELAGE
jgi:hypothetical protein